MKPWQRHGGERKGCQAEARRYKCRGARMPVGLFEKMVAQ
jgi:hypothetical protein